MANVKISALSTLPGNLVSGNDLFLITQTANSASRSLSISNARIAISDANDYITYSIFVGAFNGSNARLGGTESNVIALQGGLTGTNSTIATKDSIANVYITWNYLNANITSFASYANTTFTTNAHIDTKIAAVIDSSPETLNTLRELANALGNDSSFSTTIVNQIGTISANTVALQGGLTGANTAISTKDSIANVYATYLTSLGGLTGANTAILNLQTGLSGTNSTVATKDSISNVYATYLVAKGGIDSANTSIVNLQTGLTGSNTRISGTESNVIALRGGISGANTNILNLIVGLLGSNTNITDLQSAISGADTYIVNLQTGLSGTNSTIATKDSIANVYSTYLAATSNDFVTYTRLYANVNSVQSNLTAYAAYANSTFSTSNNTPASVTYIVSNYTTSAVNSYPIGTVVSSVNNVSVHLNGVYQNKNQYILSNSSANIQFTDASLASSLSLEIVTIR